MRKIAEVIERVNLAAWRGKPRPRGFSPSIDARLVSCYCPRLHSRPPAPEEGARDEFWGHGPRLSGPWPDHGPHGLVGCAESVHRDVPPRRNGLHGLTATGRRRLREGCALLEESRRRCVMWTITLGDDEHAQLRELDSWPRFQNAIRHRLVRLLKRRRLEPLAVAVVELHPGRSGREVQAMAHLHVVFQSLYLGQGRWAITTEDLDLVIAQALEAAGVTDYDIRAAGQVERIRRSVGNYVSKYVSKGSRESGSPEAGAFQGDPRGCPRQWWFMTARLQFLCARATCRLPSEFLAWICDHREPPTPGAAVTVQRVEIRDPRAPTCWNVRFRSPAALLRVWSRYETASRFGAGSYPTESTEHGCIRSCQPPEQHQHLRAAAGVRGHGTAERRQRTDGERGARGGGPADVSGSGGDDRGQHRPVRGLGVRSLRLRRAEQPVSKGMDGGAGRDGERAKRGVQHELSGRLVAPASRPVQPLPVEQTGELSAWDVRLHHPEAGFLL